MVATNHHKVMLTKLKKQVRLLLKREEQAKRKLRHLVTKMRQASKTYKTRLTTNVRVMKSKIAAAHASTYAKMAADMEKQMQKSIEAKSKAFAVAVAKIEKQHAVKIGKKIAKKVKKIAKLRNK